jgi:hypothetical protein
MAAPVATRIASNEGNMVGARIATADGHVTVVLFNAEDAQVPAPIVSATYTVPSPAGAAHMLCGMKPNATYAVSMAGNTVTVSQSPSGSFASSSAGVLQFGLLPNAVHPADATVPATPVFGSAYPNPMRGAGTFEYTLPRRSRVLVELFTLLGTKVRTLSDDVMDAGVQRAEWRIDDLPAGGYLCRLQTADGVAVKFFSVVK